MPTQYMKEISLSAKSIFNYSQCRASLKKTKPTAMHMELMPQQEPKLIHFQNKKTT